CTWRVGPGGGCAATLNANDRSDKTDVAAVSSHPGDILIDGAEYLVKLEYRDTLGNSSAVKIHQDFKYDKTAPLFSQVTPVSGQNINSPVISYELSEDLQSGSILWIANINNKPASPVKYAFSSGELTAGYHKISMSGNSFTFSDSTVYSFKLFGIDKAGNLSDTIIKSPIFFDISTTPPRLLKPGPHSF
ncbi:MAG: hypothetical protein GY869_30605, partial [Planctomycetes bacterium]|nr:hypothetical protein [Planctomycetota bacterium]